MENSLWQTIHVGDRENASSQVEELEFGATNAEPGSAEKLEILALRIRQGLPLWHPEDRHTEDVPHLLNSSMSTESGDSD